MSKPTKCKSCGEEYQKYNSTQKACSVKCALSLVKKANDKEFRKETKRLKEKIKSRSEWLNDAQVIFNRFIRLRDEKAGYGCISCNESLRDINGKGGVYDAGHYRSRGANPELRFNEDNVFRQCKKCNRQLSGNVANMRIGILQRIGQERLDLVEGPHDAKKYTIDEIKALIKLYRQKIKDLE